MSPLILTILLAFIIVGLALCALAIGWLLTGKSKIKGGMCGKLPKEKDKECGDSNVCDICRKDDDKKS